MFIATVVELSGPAAGVPSNASQIPAEVVVMTRDLQVSFAAKSAVFPGFESVVVVATCKKADCPVNAAPIAGNEGLIRYTAEAIRIATARMSAVALVDIVFIITFGLRRRMSLSTARKGVWFTFLPKSLRKYL